MITPRDYQIELVNGIIRKISEGFKRIAVQSPTGSGKTVAFSYLLHRYFAKFPYSRVGIIVHREELKNQTRNTLNSFGINCEVEMVETFNNRAKINQLGNYSLLIFDETHIGNFSKLFTHFPNTIIIGFSATPISATKKHPLKADFETIVTGIPISELIDRGFLCTPMHRAPDTDVPRSQLKTTGGDFNLKQMGESFSRPKLIHAVYDSYQTHTPATKALVFNTTVEHSLKVHEYLLSKGLQSQHLDGNAPEHERKAKLSWLKRTPGAILNNVNILTAGFDEPTLETVIFNRCTKSLPLWLQVTGRGGRTAPGKQKFNITDLGENILQHGFWHHNHDWTDYFYNPDKAGTRSPAMKNCPSCEGLIFAGATVCSECGHLMPRKIEYSDNPVILRLYDQLDPPKLVESTRAKGHKEMAAVWRIVDQIKKADAPEAERRKLLEEKVRETYKLLGRRCYQNNIAYWNEQL